ncbi:MAG: hypothetical protein Q8Q94_02375 [bacterium]|nr:hypothetical protein [bacterium]
MVNVPAIVDDIKEARESYTHAVYEKDVAEYEIEALFWQLENQEKLLRRIVQKLEG